MACEEHKTLAQYVKEVHSALRKSSINNGPEKAWQEHCGNKNILTNYAQCMNRLATTYWEASSADNPNKAMSRIEWSADFCHAYFKRELYLKYKNRDIDIASKIDLCINTEECFSDPIQLIDVGSCYNPFKKFDYLKVLPIDLCPANNTVFKCDFLNVKLGLVTDLNEMEVVELRKSSFDAVTFCFLLEYIPDSRLRIKACETAYDLLKPGGLLIINTPDSKHVAANSKIMKCWRYTLAHIGFSRIKYEKFKHMHCMAFRKSLHKDIAVRWAKLHKKPFMAYSLNIPQDFNNGTDDEILYLQSEKIDVSVYDFEELPFNDD